MLLKLESTRTLIEEPFDINFEVQQRPSRDIAFLRGSEPKAFSGSAV